MSISSPLLWLSNLKLQYIFSLLRVRGQKPLTWCSWAAVSRPNGNTNIVTLLSSPLYFTLLASGSELAHIDEPRRYTAASTMQADTRDQNVFFFRLVLGNCNVSEHSCTSWHFYWFSWRFCKVLERKRIIILYPQRWEYLVSNVILFTVQNSHYTI